MSRIISIPPSYTSTCHRAGRQVLGIAIGLNFSELWTGADGRESI